MYYSYKDIVESLPIKKNSKSSLWVKLFVRKASFPLTWILINLRCSAWGASILSICVALTGFGFLLIDNELSRITGVILTQLWLILDCVDGNIARVQKKSSEYGEFVDAISGYYVTGFIFLGIGVAAYNTSSIVSSPYLIGCIILGGVSSVSGLLCRLIHQKYTYTTMVVNDNASAIPENEAKQKFSLQYIRSRVDKELGISGLFMPFLIVACVFHIYDLMTFFYCLFQVVSLIIITLYYAVKAR
ncbi:CDP-alcohol phosphatidyltransferase family protein [Porphyromonas sp. COT-239 OH1446]|uniref:CDP-alcohol phosphatidyltransferase family protein n=1 Tax=Porphyromonas sp. COT-239 OH1446 TaxID=1515613 RepID=UPI00052DAF0A|nr:CDP-alcohol phosphatidyltransferase family protein [Porphyromonas sp. COT-239 OH1446]KGN70212.1 hypothetical protein HQ37_03980 [Porphyromonas sp. COT-239 OH1446]